MASVDRKGLLFRLKPDRATAFSSRDLVKIS